MNEHRTVTNIAVCENNVVRLVSLLASYLVGFWCTHFTDSAPLINQGQNWTKVTNDGDFVTVQAQLLSLKAKCLIH